MTWHITALHTLGRFGIFVSSITSFIIVTQPYNLLDIIAIICLLIITAIWTFTPLILESSDFLSELFLKKKIKNKVYINIK